MAKKRRKKRGGQRPFPVLAPISRKQFRRTLKRRTKGIVRGQVRPLRRQFKQERRASTGRTQDIKQFFNFQRQELDEAQRRSEQALNRLIAQRGASSAEAQASLGAALGASRGEEIALGQRLGSVAPPSLTPQAQLATFGSSEALQNQLAREAGVVLAGGAARQQISSLERLRARETEQQRASAVLRDIQQRIADVRASRPEVRTEQRRGLLEELRAAQAQRFQQRIARSELKLQRRGQRLAEKTQRQQFKLDRRALGLQEQQLKAEIQQAIRDGRIKKAQGDKSISKFQVGVKDVEKWLGARKGKITDAQIKALFRRLTKSLRLPQGVALRVIAGAGPRAMQRWANARRGSSVWRNPWVTP